MILNRAKKKKKEKITLNYFESRYQEGENSESKNCVWEKGATGVRWKMRRLESEAERGRETGEKNKAGQGNQTVRATAADWQAERGEQLINDCKQSTIKVMIALVPSLSARNMKVRREVTTSNLLSPSPRTCLIALARIIPLEYIS